MPDNGAGTAAVQATNEVLEQQEARVSSAPAGNLWDDWGIKTIGRGKD